METWARSGARGYPIYDFVPPSPHSDRLISASTKQPQFKRIPGMLCLYPSAVEGILVPFDMVLQVRLNLASPWQRLYEHKKLGGLPFYTSAESDYFPADTGRHTVHST